MSNYTGTSIVDYLKSVGQSSDITSRIALGKQYGIDYSKSTTNYATENTQLLNILVGKATTTPTSLAQAVGGQAPTTNLGIPLATTTAGTTTAVIAPATQKVTPTISPETGQTVQPTTPSLASTLGGQIGTYIDVNTGLGYSGPKQNPYDISADAVTGKPITTPSPTTLPVSTAGGIEPVITPVPTITPTPPLAPKTEAIPLAPTPIPTSTADLEAGQVGTFEPPTPTAVSTLGIYADSMLTTLETQRTALEKAYQTQLDNIKTKTETAQKKQDDLLAQYKGTLETEVKPLMEPFRAATEASERARLKVEENYFANQTLTNELETLLTQIQGDLQKEKDITGLASIRQPRIAQATEDATARVGVIEAVMAARNNQITVANNLIDRTVTAITADRTDQLNYYNSLLSFYDKQIDMEGNKILALSKEEQTWIGEQVNLLKMDLASTQSNVDYIKKLMVDPNTAKMMADSGVTLNDSPIQVQQKFAAYDYQQEIVALSNKMETDGYEYLTLQQAMAKPADEINIQTDSKGVQRYYWKAAEVISGGETTTGGINYYADKVASGEWDITNVPSEIRNQVVDKISTMEEQKTQIPAPPDYVASFQQYKNAGWTREQVESSWLSQYNEGKIGAMQLKNKDEMYKNFPEIKSALDEVYGKAPGTWEKVKDWWSNLWK